MFGVHGNGYVVQNWFMIRISIIKLRDASR